MVILVFSDCMPSFKYMLISNFDEKKKSIYFKTYLCTYKWTFEAKRAVQRTIGLATIVWYRSF